MKRKISFLVSCLILLSFPTQVLHAKIPEEIITGQSQNQGTDTGSEAVSSNSDQDTSNAQTESGTYSLSGEHELTTSLPDVETTQITQPIRPIPNANSLQRSNSITYGSSESQVNTLSDFSHHTITMEQLIEKPMPESTNLEIKKINNLPSCIDPIVKGSVIIKFNVEKPIRKPKNFESPIMSDDVLSYPKPLFIRCPTAISSNNPSVRSKVTFKWLTISSSAVVVFENLDISGKIQVTGGSKVIFKNCNIHNLDTKDYAVDIFCSSWAVFENCSLDNEKKECISIRDRSVGCFNNCVFPHSASTAITLQQLAAVQLFDCDFSQNQGNSIQLYKQSMAFLQNCKFHDISGQCIFAINHSEVDIRGCQFNNCKNGSIIIADFSKIQTMECDFQNINGIAIYIVKDSNIQSSDGLFEQINGNGIVFDSSTGEITDCTFDSINAPAIHVSGLGSNPIIKRCTIRNISDHNFIASRCNAGPIFENIHIGGFTSNTPVISCSDFSGTVFKNIDFEISDVIPEILTCNAAKVKIIPSTKCKVEYIHENGQTETHTFGDGEPEYILRVLEKTSGQAVALPTTNENIQPEFIDFESIQSNTHHTHPDVKVVSSPCCHAINSCPMCKNHDHDVFNFDGKNLTCKNCGILDFKHNTFKCNVCKGVIGEVLKPFEECSTCVICFENSPNIILLPCGHKCVCHECVNQCLHFKKSCPECRENVYYFRYDFFNN